MIELAIVVKASVLLALGLGVAALSRRARASVRHLWLAATLGSVAVLPLLAVASPPVTFQVPAAYATIAPPVSAPAPAIGHAVRVGDEAAVVAPAPSRVSLPTWQTLARIARIAWLAGAIVMLSSLAVSFARVRRVRREGLPRTDLAAETRALAADAGVSRAIDVLEHEAIPAPLTCGIWRPAIVLPRDARDWAPADVRRALVHELAHVARGDWAVQLAARAVCACYWFHPLAWSAWRGLCLEAERACDDAVLKSDDRVDYADQLVLLARRYSTAPSHAVLGMAKRSDLAARVTALLDDRQRRGAAGLLTIAGACLAAAFVVAAIAPVRAVAVGPEFDQDRLQPTGSATASWKISGKKETGRARPIDRALLEAAAEGDVESIDQLLQAGANVNAAVDGDGSPLIAASRTNRVDVVKLLLDRGADPNLPVPGDGSPLIAASAEGAVKVVALLLERGANVELVVPGDENPLIQASGSGHLEVVKLLVGRGANVNARVWVDEHVAGARGEYRTPLSMARRGRHGAVVDFLIASGARD